MQAPGSTNGIGKMLVNEILKSTTLSLGGGESGSGLGLRF